MPVLSPPGSASPTTDSGGCTPAPRNERPTSVRMLFAMISVKRTSTDDAMFGSSSVNMIRTGRALRDRGLDELLLAQRQHLAAQRPPDVGDEDERDDTSGSRGSPLGMSIGPWWKPLIESAVPSAIPSRITGNAQIRSKKREMTQSRPPPK